MSDVNRDASRESFCQAIRAMWWLVLIRGMLMVLLGGYALLNPLMTSAALAQVVGVFLILDGALAVYAGLAGQTDSRFWTILRGVILIIAGLFALSHPMVVALVNITFIVFLLALGSIVSGVIEIYVAIRDRREIEGEGWMILSGVLAILFGAILFAAPIATGMFMIQILGVFAIIAGISLIVLSFRFRRFGAKLKNALHSS